MMTGLKLEIVLNLLTSSFLDLSKAFDCVPHKRLLLKLNRHGIDGPLLQWFKHFLTNRMQRVVIRGKCSDWTSVKSGVP